MMPTPKKARLVFFSVILCGVMAGLNFGVCLTSITHHGSPGVRALNAFVGVLLLLIAAFQSTVFLKQFELRSKEL